MFRNFGFFARGEKVQDEETGLTLTELRNLDGVEFYTGVSRQQAEWDGSGNFLRAEFPIYASVNEDFTVRVVHRDPSAAVPVDAYFVATDDIEIRPGMIVDIDTGQFASPPPPPAPIAAVSMRQAKIQLSRAGYLAAADAAIAGMKGQAGEEARIEWQYATELRRDHPLVAGIGQVLDLDDAAIDVLFAEAAQIG